MLTIVLLPLVLAVCNASTLFATLYSNTNPGQRALIDAATSKVLKAVNDEEMEFFSNVVFDGQSVYFGATSSGGSWLSSFNPQSLALERQIVFRDPTVVIEDLQFDPVQKQIIGIFGSQSDPDFFIGRVNVSTGEVRILVNLSNVESVSESSNVFISPNYFIPVLNGASCSWLLVNVHTGTMQTKLWSSCAALGVVNCEVTCNSSIAGIVGDRQLVTFDPPTYDAVLRGNISAVGTFRVLQSSATLSNCRYVTQMSTHVPVFHNSIVNVNNFQVTEGSDGSNVIGLMIEV